MIKNTEMSHSEQSSNSCATKIDKVGMETVTKKDQTRKCLKLTPFYILDIYIYVFSIKKIL